MESFSVLALVISFEEGKGELVGVPQPRSRLTCVKKQEKGLGEGFLTLIRFRLTIGFRITEQ